MLSEEWIGYDIVQNTSPVLFKIAFKNVTEYYGITNRVSAVLHDNGSNVRTIAEGIEADDMPCAAHILQLVVKSAMKTPQIKTVITATSKHIVGHASYSAIASEALGKKTKQNKKQKTAAISSQ